MKKIFFLLGFFISFAQIVFASTIFTSNSSGSLQTSFYINQSVYLAPSTTNITWNSTKVRIYTVADSNSWLNGTSLTDLSGGYETFTTNNSGYLATASVIWSSPAAGSYDVVADVNDNGIYESNFDFVSDRFQVFQIPGAILNISIGRNSTSKHNITIPSNNDVALLQIKMTSGLAEGILLNSVSLIANGTGNDAWGVSNVKLVEDSNANGIYNPSKTLADGKYIIDNGTVPLKITNGYLIPANTTAYFLIAYTMTNNSLNGDTYSFWIPSITAIGASTGTRATINGLPIYSPFFTVNSTSLPTRIATTSTTTAVSSSSTTTTETTKQNQNYFWVYIAGGISAAIIIAFLVLYLRPSNYNQYQYKPTQ
jgi:hypothetical protein